MAADSFLTVQTIEIVVLGLLAFVFGTGSGVIGAKIMNLFLEGEDQPAARLGRHRLGADRGRVGHNVALEDDSENYLIYHAMGPNLAGVFGTAISGRHHAGPARGEMAALQSPSASRIRISPSAPRHNSRVAEAWIAKPAVRLPGSAG